MTKQEHTQIRKDARTSFLIAMTIVVSIVLCAPRDASAQQGSFGMSITIVEPDEASKDTESREYSGAYAAYEANFGLKGDVSLIEEPTPDELRPYFDIGTEASTVSDVSLIRARAPDEPLPYLVGGIGTQSSYVHDGSAIGGSLVSERFNKFGKPQTQNAVLPRASANEPRVLDRKILSDMLANGSQINDRGIGGDGVLDYLVVSNALGSRIMKIASRTNNTRIVEAYLVDVDYLLNLGAIPNTASVSLMNKMATQQQMGIDSNRIQQVASRMQEVLDDYEARLAASKADPTLPHVEELQPYLSAVEVRKLRLPSGQLDVDH